VPVSWGGIKTLLSYFMSSVFASCLPTVFRVSPTTVTT